MGSGIGVCGSRFRALLASSSVAALLSAPARRRRSRNAPSVPAPIRASVSNSAAINCININGITVTGDVTNTITGTLTAAGVSQPSRTGITINNASVGGAVINAGHITASTLGNGIFVTNDAIVSGGISNSGTITAGNGVFVGGTIARTYNSVAISTFAGGISNSGTIAADDNGIIVGGFAHTASSATVSTFAGGISNNGAISAGGNGIFVGGSGFFFGSIAISTFAGGISNSGRITAGGNGIFVGGVTHTFGIITIATFAGGISNSGTISAGQTGILVKNVGSFSGGIGNSGQVSAAGTGSGILVGGNAANTGNGNSQYVSVTTSTFSGGISNSGTISAGDNGIFVGGNATAIGSGNRQIASTTISTFAGGISNSGTIAAGGNGILVGGTAAVTHALDNNNTATATISTFSGGIVNSGTISAAGAGIWVGGDANLSAYDGFYNTGSVTISTFSGGISNSGTISAGGNGIWVGGDASTGVITEGDNASVTISTFADGIGNSGTISAGGNGIFVGGSVSIGADTYYNTASSVTISTFSGGISNSGTISAGGNGIFVGGSASFSQNSTSNTVSVTISTFSGGIVNSGTISAIGNGIFVGGSASIGPGFNNAASVTISTFSGGISNSGRISAGGAGIEVGGSTSIASGFGYGSGYNNAASVTISTFSGNISNSGTIIAQTGIVVNKVATFLGAIANSGTITGTGGTAIDISAAPNAMAIDITGGTIVGNMLGAGTMSGDTLNFALGNGTFTYDNSFINFQAVDYQFRHGGAQRRQQQRGGGAGQFRRHACRQRHHRSAGGAGVTINSGGTLEPGTPGAVGTLTIVSNLYFNSGSGYLVTITNAGTNSSTDVTGATTIGGGTVYVKPQLGQYHATTYTLLTASAGVTVNTPFAGPDFVGPFDYIGTATLTYPTDQVDLVLGAGYAILAAPPGAGQNQQNVVTAIDKYITQRRRAAAGLCQSRQSVRPGLFERAHPARRRGRDRRADQRLPDDDAVPRSDDRSNRRRGRRAAAAGRAALPTKSSRTCRPMWRWPMPARCISAPPQQSFDQRWSAWGSGFGGSGTYDGNAAVGSNNVTASDYGYAGGMDYHLTPDTVYGFALAGGGTNWSLATIWAAGGATAFEAGVYAKTHWGAAYLSGALGFANHWFTTNRIAVGDQLTASFQGQSYAARGEVGYRYAVAGHRIHYRCDALCGVAGAGFPHAGL